MSDREDDEDTSETKEEVSIPEPEPEPLPTLPDEIILLNKTHSRYAISVRAVPKDPENAVEIDIQAAAFDQDGKLLGMVNNEEGTNTSFDGGMRYSLKGAEEESLDEVHIDLNNVANSVRSVYYMSTSYEGNKFADAESIVVTYTDLSNNETVVSYPVEVAMEDGQTAWIFASIQRAAHKQNYWEFYRKNEKLTKESWEESVVDFQPMVAALPALTPVSVTTLDLNRGSGFGNRWCGRTLNPAQRSQLAGAMLSLQTERNLPTLYHWGTIYGPIDYTILVSVAVTKGIKKRFFCSQGDKSGITYKFFELPILDDFIRTNAPKASGMFRGRPGYVLPYPEDAKKLNEDGEEEEPMMEEEEEDEDSTLLEKLTTFPNRTKRKLLEIERLSYVVNTIDHNTSLVPRGRLRMNPLTQIESSSSFKGLSLEDAKNLRNYMHFRQPTRPETLRNLRGPLTTNTTAFLDSLSLKEDIRGLWALQTNFEQTEVCLRSLFCPGFEFRCEVGNPTGFGGLYQGFGELNHSLVFMLPQV